MRIEVNCIQRLLISMKLFCFRALKKAGSCKMTGCCPAEIIVSVQITQKVYVEYYSTHIGHEVSVEHFRLSYECRRDLAGNFVHS